MISIIITSAFEEHSSIGRAIDSILNQKIKEKFELLIVTPDKETMRVVSKYENPNLRIIEDPFLGKPYALNLAFKEAKGDILVLSDGDVFLDKNAINFLLEPFKDDRVGIVSGRPISLNSRRSKWGYISHLLTDIGAHQTRILRRKKNKMIVCSGYLYAFRKKLISKIPEYALAEDAVISHTIFENGYKTIYAPEAKVYVKYPTNFSDWLKQKKRSAGGYNQLKYIVKSRKRMRSFFKESISVLRVFAYPVSIKEFIWTLELIVYRLYLWFFIFIDINIKKKGFGEMWVKVSSTK